MMREQTDEPVEEGRQHLEDRANAVRARLLRRLDVLDQRRHRVVKAASALGKEMQHRLPVIVGVAAGSLVLVGAALYAQRRKRQQRREAALLRSVALLLTGGSQAAEEQFAPPPPNPWLTIAKRLALTFGARAAKSIARQALMHYVAARKAPLPPPQLPAANVELP